MKTKAEALRNPAPGDQWMKRVFRQITGNDGAMVTFRSKGGKTSYMWTATFQRWAAGSEYMGKEGQR